MFSASSPAKIVFLDRATLSPHTVLKPFPFPHLLQAFDRTAAHELAARIGDADIVVTNKVRLDAAALADARRVRMIAIAATGTDIVGDGVLGRAVAGIARALGMRVRFAAHGDASGDDYAPLDTLLRDCDVITLHCPLTPATRHLIDAAAFARMARRPLLINTARGGLVDESALVDALQSGQIAGAGFDVVTQEPLPAAHPFHAILSHPAFILTPHVAWASDEAMQALADQLVDNVAAFAGGMPRHVV
ncbi:hypothetical protein LGM58_09420 [Burkholderia contaminans]|uniref:NAD(P)-dependent oxidoreductase n=1 Tax=Burkholderia contaminans TaxID=488447 RepID=UPI001CF438E0|nr:NAD(P)-dependent oxidoreductase [Burkholderia contaminans]MCA7883409.1 hypothetical protein [Burkholderia contaminans]